MDGVEDGDNEYAYNPNGAMTMDLNKGITNISYDQLGNLREITLSGNRSIRYIYAADGTRLRTTHTRRVGNSYLRYSAEYLGNLIVKNGTPSMYRFPGGCISFHNNNSLYHYYTRDHLGNNRAVVNEYGGIEQVTHYYPFGAVYADAGYGDAIQRFKYNGKELDRMHGLNQYDYGARNYDPLLCRFTQIDPLAEKYYWISPYAYCANNPVNAVDPDGKKIVMGRNNSLEYNKQYNSAIDYLKDHGCSSVINFLESCETIITINEIESKEQNYTEREIGTNEIGWKAKEGLLTDNGYRLSPAIRLFHELTHQEHKLKNPQKFLKDTEPNNSLYQNADEENIIKNEETFAARRCGEIPQNAVSRESHGGIGFETISSTSRIIINTDDNIEIWRQTWEYNDDY